MKKNDSSEPWPCDWADAELAQLKRDAACSFRENLIWIEEMTEFAERFSETPPVPHPGHPKVLPK